MFRMAAWTGLLALAMTVGLILVFPSRMGPLPSGMHTPILAFELARTREEIETMFGPPRDPQRGQWRRAMDLGNYADFAYLVVYGAFLVTFSRALAASGDRLIQLGVRLAPFPSAMDILENLQLLSITGALGGDYRASLSRLQLFTWCKWIAIVIVVATWIPGMWSRGGPGRLGAVLAGLTVASTALAFVARGAAAELMALGVGLTMSAALILAFRGSAMKYAQPTFIPSSKQRNRLPPA